MSRMGGYNISLYLYKVKSRMSGAREIDALGKKHKRQGNFKIMLASGLNAPNRPTFSTCQKDSSLRQHSHGFLDFAKMQALGNDFVLVSQADIDELAAFGANGDWRVQVGELARVLCDRHFGIGADGLIVVCQSDSSLCDLGWIYTNSDGSPSAMCGNGIRCLALWAKDRGLLVSAESLTIETGKGPVLVNVVNEDQITTNLGKPALSSAEIPMAGLARPKVIKEPIVVDNLTFHATCVNVGNPHCVIFNPPIAACEYPTYAGKIQSLNLFPEGVNVEFVLVETRSCAKALVWERGCGPTLACASGAAAVLVAGVLEDKMDRQAVIELPGGSLTVEWLVETGDIQLTGPAREVYRGTVNLEFLFSEAGNS